MLELVLLSTNAPAKLSNAACEAIRDSTASTVKRSSEAAVSLAALPHWFQSQ